MQKLKVLVILMCGFFSMSSFGSIARMFAASQDYSEGSFYLQDNRNIFRNPMAILQTPGQITIEGEKEAMYVADKSYALSLGRAGLGKKSVPLMESVFSLSDSLAAGIQTNFKSGEGLNLLGVALGGDPIEGLSLYVNPSFLEKDKFNGSKYHYTVGGTYAVMGAFSLYGEYNDFIKGSGLDNSLTSGLAYKHEMEYMTGFADLNYGFTNNVGEDLKNKMSIKAGIMYVAEPIDTEVVFSIKKGIVFDEYTKVALGAMYWPTKMLSIDGALEADKIGKKDFNDMGFKLSLSYLL